MRWPSVCVIALWPGHCRECIVAGVLTEAKTRQYQTDSDYLSLNVVSVFAFPHNMYQIHHMNRICLFQDKILVLYI
jgi:hypothetical protein